MKTTTIATVILAACTCSVYAQTGQPKAPLIQLMDDVNAAVPRAHITDAQKTQLDADAATLEAARQARLQGQSVDRMKVGGALKDIKDVADSGAFDSADQQKIDADVQALLSS